MATSFSLVLLINKKIFCKRFFSKFSSFDQNSESFEGFYFVSILNRFDMEALLSKNIYDR